MSDQDINTNLLQAIGDKEEKIEVLAMTMSRRDIVFKIIIGVMFVCFIAFMVWQQVSHRHEMAQQLINLTETKDGFVLNDLPVLEQKDKYRKFMIRVFDVYGFQYNKDYTKALNPTDQANYIDMTFELDNLLGFKHYEIPVLHLLETGFNPKAHNTNSGLDEKGIGQQTWATALYAEKLCEFMPDKLRDILHVDLHSSDDLYDWRTSTKITYILAWFHRRAFVSEEWWVSVYHWGGFLTRRWNKNGCDIPATFKINGIEYVVIEYYVDWKKLNECFNRGNLESGKEIVEQWNDRQKKLMSEEIQIRTAMSIIKRLRNEIEEKNFYESKLKEKYENANKIIDECQSSLYKIYYGASKEKTGEKIRAELKKAKGIVRSAINKLNDLISQGEIDWFLTSILIAIVLIVIVLIWLIIRNRRIRCSKKQ